MKTRVVNIKSGEPYDVYIGRGSKWGNPYRIGPDGSRDDCLNGYFEYLLHSPRLIMCLPELQGKRLGCFCKPSQCHGDILAALADLLLEDLN